MAEENNNGYGVASFECGRGNTMRIDFPNVIEADAYMNIGVALMPFMEDGYHFIKEDNISKAAGFNKVETDFVEYLYQIRKANRKGTAIKHNVFTRLTSDPKEGKLRQRIFIAGTIFPILSIRYLGGDINCASSRIEIKSFPLGKIDTVYGGIFKGQGFSSKYIQIDNSIAIYVPENTEMGIDYINLLIDFFTNGQKTEKTTKYGEFPDMKIYELATDNKTLADGCWLTKNREDNDETWQNACMYILEHKLQGVLAPFAQIADFYTLLDDKITNETKHKTRWLKGAKKLVNSLKIMDGGFTLVANDVETILNELNIGICDYAITQFHDLFYGKYKNNPLEKRQDAYEWDLAFVKHEQGVVAIPIYAKTNKKTIEKYQDMADQDAKGIHGFESFVIGNPMSPMRVIPEFDEPWNGKVTDAQFRIDLPMLMLWLDRHKPTGENFKDKIDENGYLLEEYKQIIENYEAK